MSKIVLGKGLNALIPGNETTADETSEYRSIALEKIRPNPMQPRRAFDEARLQELAESFKENGIMQPLVVRKSEGGYDIIAGERRYRAAKLAGLQKVPVLVLEDIDNNRLLRMALVENIQRENLNPLELAEAYKQLLERGGFTHNQLAEQLGKSRTAVTNQLRLLTLPDSVQKLIREGRITEGHARSILAMGTETEMLEMVNRILTRSLSVREVERSVQRTKKRRLVPKKKLPELVEIENQLKRLLGTSVKISHGLKKGKIEIEYYGDDDLERLLELFVKLEM
ncbi:MAG: ParB/RepB/Spo0J family partition protein [Candidatus Zixiibacteriota bacterium]